MKADSAASPCDFCAHAGSRRDFLRLSAAVAFGLHGLSALRLGADTVTYPLPAADGAHFDRENQVILVRWQDHVYAFALSCPHQRTALRWIENDSRFQCPKHKSKYQPDGTFISGRATRGMDRYALRRDADTIVVDLSVLHKQNSDPGGWSMAVVKVGGLNE